MSAEHVPIAEALGRVLALDAIATTSIPPFANSSMDGYAVRAADVHQAAAEHPVTLTVIGDVRAGMVLPQSVRSGQAARIMTGAPLPKGADAVIPVEDTGDAWNTRGDAALPERVTVYRSVQAGDYVRPAGEDIAPGERILSAGVRLRPQDIGVLVSIGYAQVAVRRQPRVAIIATGDELVDAGQPLALGQIRNSNSYVIAGLVSENGGVPHRLPIARDTLESVRQTFQDALDLDPDIIVSSAGVSVGTHDVVRAVVDELGRVELWRINLRPGKPLAFGHVQGVPFIGLPGNPVSAMVTFDVFVRPALVQMLGGDPHDVPMAEAALGETVESDGRRSYLRVRLRREDGRLVAYVTGTQSSGVLMSMVVADGLLILPEGVTEAPEGSRYPVRLLRHLKRLP